MKRLWSIIKQSRFLKRLPFLVIGTVAFAATTGCFEVEPFPASASDYTLEYHVGDAHPLHVAVTINAEFIDMVEASDSFILRNLVCTIDISDASGDFANGDTYSGVCDTFTRTALLADSDILLKFDVPGFIRNND